MSTTTALGLRRRPTLSRSSGGPSRLRDMDVRRSLTKPPADGVAAPLPPAVIGLRDHWLLPAVRAAVGDAGMQVADVVSATNQLLRVTTEWQPRLVVATLDVLGAEPTRTIRRMLVDSPGTSVVVLSELESLPVWLLDAGARAVISQVEIGELRRVVRALQEQ